MDLIATQDQQSYIFKLFRSGANAARFEEVHARLTRAIEDLGVQAVADIAALDLKLDTKMREAAAADQAQFDQLTKHLDANHQDVVARLLDLEGGLHGLLKAVYPAVPGVQSSASPDRAMQGAAAATSLPPKPWRVNYDAFVFERNRRGDKVLCGSGVSSHVYKATFGNQLVAVKEFTHAFIKHPDHNRRFVQEVELLYRFNHPNLAQLYGASELCGVDDCPFLALEWLPRTLYVALFIDNLLDDYSTKIEVARGIAAGLEYLHCTRPRIVHHDMKPDNVMLTEDLRAKLIDFGLADTTATIRTTAAYAQGPAAVGAVLGTPGYMGPEKLNNTKERTSHLTDTFAYGITLYQLATKQEPYTGIDKADISDFIRAGKRPEFPAGLATSGLAVLIRACWAHEVKTRPEMSTVAACLRACVVPGGSPAIVSALLDPVAAQVRPRHDLHVIR